MITLPTLRNYQDDFFSKLRRELAEHRRVIACMPTGAGKSTVAKYIYGAIANKPKLEGQSGYSVIAVHRRGLVDNLADTFTRAPTLPHGLIMSGRDTSWGNRVQVASIDTLLSWYVSDKYDRETTFDFLGMDEAHSHHVKFAKFVEAHDVKRAELGLKPAFVLGLSATPMAKGLSQTYRKIVTGPSVQWLIDQGFLVPFKYVEARVKGDLSKLKKQGTKFTDASLKEAFDGLAGNLIEDWKATADGRQTVGFFSRLSHAQEACDSLNRAGISARYVDGKTGDNERRDLFDGLQAGDYRYLCNVGIVDRGTDIPAIECIQLATAIGSITRLIQILGRGARINEGKTHCICLDHGGSIRRLNTFFEDPIEWVLEAEREKELNHEGKPTIECPQCGVVYRGGKCRSCGYEPTPKERSKQGVEWHEGELVEITKRDPPKLKKTCEQILIESLYRAGLSGRTWRQAWGIGKREAERLDMKYRVPRAFVIAGVEYKSVEWDHPDTHRKVKDLYPELFG